MPSESVEVPPYTAAFPIRRPYPDVILSIRDKLHALLETMEAGSMGHQPPSDRPMDLEEWEAHRPGMIIGCPDWDTGCLSLQWAMNEDNPSPAARSPVYTLELTDLKSFALAAAAPFACFESYALFLLSEGQYHLEDFFRDGSTDDIPFHRHLIFAQGIAGITRPVWVSNVIFIFDEAPP